MARNVKGRYSRLEVFEVERWCYVHGHKLCVIWQSLSETSPSLEQEARVEDLWRALIDSGLRGYLEYKVWSNRQGSTEKGSFMKIWTLFCSKGGRIAETVRSFLLTTRLSTLARAPAVRSLTHHTLYAHDHGHKTIVRCVNHFPRRVPPARSEVERLYEGLWSTLGC
jgi:hypothetical protein